MFCNRELIALAIRIKGCPPFVEIQDVFINFYVTFTFRLRLALKNRVSLKWNIVVEVVSSTDRTLAGRALVRPRLFPLCRVGLPLTVIFIRGAGAGA